MANNIVNQINGAMPNAQSEEEKEALRKQALMQLLQSQDGQAQSQAPTGADVVEATPEHSPLTFLEGLNKDLHPELDPSLRGDELSQASLAATGEMIPVAGGLTKPAAQVSDKMILPMLRKAIANIGNSSDRELAIIKSLGEVGKIPKELADKILQKSIGGIKAGSAQAPTEKLMPLADKVKEWFKK